MSDLRSAGASVTDSRRGGREQQWLTAEWLCSGLKGHTEAWFLDQQKISDQVQTLNPTSAPPHWKIDYLSACVVLCMLYSPEYTGLCYLIANMHMYSVNDPTKWSGRDFTYHFLWRNVLFLDHFRAAAMTIFIDSLMIRMLNSNLIKNYTITHFSRNSFETVDFKHIWFSVWILLG